MVLIAKTQVLSQEAKAAGRQRALMADTTEHFVVAAGFTVRHDNQ